MAKNVNYLRQDTALAVKVNKSYGKENHLNRKYIQ